MSLSGGMVVIMLYIGVFSITAMSFGSYSFPSTFITLLSPTPLDFINPLPTTITLRMFAYRGPCKTEPVAANSFRMTLIWLYGLCFVPKFRVSLVTFLKPNVSVSAGMVGEFVLIARADLVTSQCTGNANSFKEIDYRYCLVMCVCFDILTQWRSPVRAVQSRQILCLNFRWVAWLKL